MVLVPEVDASEELWAWLENRRQQLDASGVEARLQTNDVVSQRRGKAGIEFRRGEDLGQITMWANGMIDLDVLRHGQAKPQATTRECLSSGDIPAVLDAYLREFVGTV